MRGLKKSCDVQITRRPLEEGTVLRSCCLLMPRATSWKPPRNFRQFPKKALWLVQKNKWTFLIGLKRNRLYPGVNRRGESGERGEVPPSFEEVMLIKDRNQWQRRQHYVMITDRPQIEEAAVRVEAGKLRWGFVNCVLCKCCRVPTVYALSYLGTYLKSLVFDVLSQYSYRNPT